MYISLVGLYNFRNDIFDDIILPEKIEKNILIYHILNYAGEFELLYSNPDFFKFIITNWFKTNYYKFEKLVNTMYLEYNPIENYDRTETHSRINSKKSIGESNGTTSGSGNNEIKVAGFESNKYVSKENTTQNENTKTNSESTASENENENIESRIHGNIGVTTSQQMIQAERQLSNFNIYNIIAIDFSNEFCILVY